MTPDVRALLDDTLRDLDAAGVRDPADLARIVELANHPAALLYETLAIVPHLTDHAFAELTADEPTDLWDRLVRGAMLEARRLTRPTS